MNKNARRCIHCGTVIPEWYRSDRIHCPEKFGVIDYCKNAIHNPTTLEGYHLTKDIDKYFLECRKILKRFLGERESFEVPEQLLMDNGWSCNYGISTTLNDTGNTGYIFGEYVAEDLHNGFFKIFKNA